MAHVLAVADHTPETAVLAGLMNEAGIYLRSRVQLRSTEELLERALEIKEAAYGPDHPEVAITLGNLGLVLKDLGDLGGALLLAPRPRGELRGGPARPATHRQLERKMVVTTRTPCSCRLLRKSHLRCGTCPQFSGQSPVAVSAAPVQTQAHS